MTTFNKFFSSIVIHLQIQLKIKQQKKFIIKQQQIHNHSYFKIYDFSYMS
jgi:hypothetical protein